MNYKKIFMDVFTTLTFVLCLYCIIANWNELDKPVEMKLFGILIALVVIYASWPWKKKEIDQIEQERFIKPKHDFDKSSSCKTKRKVSKIDVFLTGIIMLSIVCFFMLWAAGDLDGPIEFNIFFIMASLVSIHSVWPWKKDRE